MLKTTDYAKRLQFSLLILLILSFPYGMPSFWVGTVVIFMFSLMFFNRPTNFLVIFKEKELLILFGFIMFTYISVFWSSIGLFDGDFKTNFSRFKYFFFLIPTIYFANFTQKQLQYLILTLVLSPLIIIIIHYTNAIGLTSIASNRTPFLVHYLYTNVFILFSSLYLYIKLLDAIKVKNHKKIFLYLLLFIITSLSLFIDLLNYSRLVNLTYLIMIFTVPMFYLSNKVKFISLFLAISLIPFVLLTSTKFQMGLQKFSEAIQKDKYEGSWGHRTGYAIVGLKIFSQKPIFGNSINDVSSKIEKMKLTNPKYFKGEEQLTRIHNGHINFLAQIGIIGYAFLLFVFYSIWKIKIQNRSIYIFKNMMLYLYLLLLLGEHYLSLKQFSNLFAILIIIFILYRTSEKFKNKSLQ